MTGEAARIVDEWPARPLPDEKAPVVVWWPHTQPWADNWGDKLNPVLVEMLSERVAAHPTDQAAPSAAPIHYVIGSSLASADSKACFWGSGFIHSSQRLVSAPENVRAVRGPLSGERVIAAGGSVMLPLGDPALLLPLFYNPLKTPEFDVGIIQHFREKGIEPLPRLPERATSKVIDITGDLQGTVNAVLSCRHILSSSLHGLILAHAYGVPATWIKISDRPLGDDFKFRDYWASIGRPGYEPTPAREGAKVDPGSTVSTPGSVLVDVFALLRACPFLSLQRQEELVARARAMVGHGLPLAILNIHAGLRERPTPQRPKSSLHPFTS